MLTTFTKAYCAENDKPYYEEQWLELCYYFIHYGDLHSANESCWVEADPTKGLGKHNALTTLESTAEKPTANHVNITKIITHVNVVSTVFNSSVTGTYPLSEKLCQ